MNVLIEDMIELWKEKVVLPVAILWLDRYEVDYS